MGLGLTSLEGMLGKEGAREELEAATSRVVSTTELVNDDQPKPKGTKPEADATAHLNFKRDPDRGSFT